VGERESEKEEEIEREGWGKREGAEGRQEGGE